MLRLFALSGVFLITALPAFGQAPQKVVPPIIDPPKIEPLKPDLPSDTARAREATVRKLLAQEITIPEVWKQPTPVLEVFEEISKMLAEKKLSLPITVNQASFVKANPEAGNIPGIHVIYPTFFQRMSVETALRIALTQFPSNDARLLVIDGRVEIVQKMAASNSVLLDRGIAFRAKGQTLGDAALELGARSGLTILFDPRCDAELKKIVDTDTPATTTVRGILTAWAEMHDLKLLADEERVALMPRAAYLAKLRDDAEEQRLLAEIAKLKVRPEPTPAPE